MFCIDCPQSLDYLPIMLYCGVPFCMAAGFLYCQSVGAYKETIEHAFQVQRRWFRRGPMPSPSWC
jgi:hypothetical protein